MNQAELEQIAQETKERMAHFAKQYVTPISRSDSPN
jgi:hypothetical protein